LQHVTKHPLQLAESRSSFQVLCM